MKKALIPAAMFVVAAFLLLTGTYVTRLSADNEKDKDADHGKSGFEFKKDSLVLSRSVYTGTASTVTIGQVLPPGCVAATVLVPGSATGVKVKCATASDNGEYPNLADAHSVWNNDKPDGSFGVTSPIFLDNLTTDGKLLATLPVPTSMIVTSFSSKSELALNRSKDGKSITFVGYHGGPICGGALISPTGPNFLDVSNSNTPGVCDPTNPVVSSYLSTPTVPTAYYRSVAEVDDDGHIQVTDGNAYSGNNGRAAIKANWLYYMAGNNNNGGLSSTPALTNQLVTTPLGISLVTSTGAELLVPGQTPPVPPNINMIGDFEINQAGYAAPDKPGKDNNFRGLTIFHNALYVTKGSGSNGVNTVYQVGGPGFLPTTANAPGTPPNLKNVPITILPGFPTSLAAGTDQKGNPAPIAFPFGIWFANANTLYVCDEGDGTLLIPPVNGNVADAPTLATAGIQKWLLSGGVWKMQYVLQNGLNIGVPYSIANYPAALNPATDGCRNITGRVDDGKVTLYAVTSTISANGDQGADPNKLVKVTDLLKATKLPTGDGDHDQDDKWGVFTTIRTATAGEVLRGVSFAPGDGDDDDRGDGDDR